MKAFAPNGLEIVGTREIIPGVASITRDSFAKDSDGNLTFEHRGGTEVHWDAQKTVTRDGRTVFVDEDGAEWTGDMIVLRAEDEETSMEGEES